MISICTYLVFIKSCVTHTDNHVQYKVDAHKYVKYCIYCYSKQYAPLVRNFIHDRVDHKVRINSNHHC